jgi:hypothetical protein
MVPYHLMEHFERYHKHVLEQCETRTLDQTISVLLRYAIGDTKEISLNEIVTIEAFFDRSEHVFGEFLQGILSSLQIEENLVFES